MTAPDDDLLLIAAAGALIGAWWYWRGRPAADENNEEGDTFMSVIENTVTDTVETVGRALWTPPAAASPYLFDIARAEIRYGLPNNLLARLLYQESRYREDIITGRTKSPVGALGIAQFMPATAREMGIDPLNPAQAIDAAGRYLQRLHGRFGSWDKALAAYNWGQGNVARRGLDRAPAETRNYFSKILADLGLA